MNQGRFHLVRCQIDVTWSGREDRLGGIWGFHINHILGFHGHSLSMSGKGEAPGS